MTTKPIGALSVILDSRAPGALGELAVRTKYGDRWSESVADGNRAVANLSSDKIDAIERDVGTQAFLEAAIALGARYGNTSPSAELAEDSIRARAALEDLFSNAEFTGKYLAGDRAANRQLSELTERAYPDLEGDR